MMLVSQASRHLRSLLRRELIASSQTCNKSSVAQEKPVPQSSDASCKQDVVDAVRGKSKLPQRKPLVKNFMLGVVDKELLRFPEVISRDDTSKLTEETMRIDQYFKDILEANTFQLSTTIPKEVIDNLKNLGLFSFSIPMEYGGKQYNASELSVASEPEQVSADASTLLMAHRLVSEIIYLFGSDHVKNKYLPKMADGSIIGTEAIFESKPTDARFCGTSASYNDEEKTWVLNGAKSYVINGAAADVFLVLTQVNTMNVSGNMEDSIAIFIVDASTPGVQVQSADSFGIRGAQQGTVSFSNASVTEENMIGDLSKSNDIIQTLLKLNRIKSGLLSIGMLKNMLRDMTHYATYTKYNGLYLKDMKTVCDRLARVTCSTYAVESMIYLTTGLIDEFEKQDVDLEAAILKLYSIESLWKSATSCMEYMGPKSLEAAHPSEIYLRNAAQLYTQNETPDSLRQYIGLCGIQYAGMNIHETIRKDRNPLFHPLHVLSRMFDKQSMDSPKMILHLEGEVHPSLDLAAKNLEQSILRLALSVEVLLSRHGAEIISEPLEVIRLAECMTLIYSMFASIARASRSYCIGLQHSDFELLIATMVAFEGGAQVRQMTTDIMHGPYATNDKSNQKIAKQLLKSQKYFYEHPLKYNF